MRASGHFLTPSRSQQAALAVGEPRSPGASPGPVSAGQVTGPSVGSLTEIAASVTSPVLVTV